MTTSKVVLALAATLLLPTIAACTQSGTSKDGADRTLRIATINYGPDDSYFRQQFTEVFEYANPNIKIEIVSPVDSGRYMYAPMQPGQKQEDPMEKMKEMMQGANPPDIVVVDYSQIGDLIDNNMLAPLDNRMTKDKFNTADIVPAVLDGIKALGNGAVYALAPTFSSSALIYNKKLFLDAGVSFPQDNMTWDETFDLARRVTKPDADNPRYGFNFYSSAGGDLFYGSQMYTQALQLNFIDDAGEKLTVDTDSWEKAWTTLIQLSKDHVMPPPPDYSKMNKMQSSDSYNPFMNDDFLSGRLAMTIMDYSQLSQIYNANKNAETIKGFTPIDWDVVTVPSDPAAKGTSTGVYLSGLMGINAKAGNAEDAWKFIRFVNGDDWARLRANSMSQLVSRKSFNKPKFGDFHLEAFTNVKPIATNNPLSKLGRDKPYVYQTQGIGQNEMQQALQGNKGVREALKAWQTQGDAMLLQLKNDPNAQMNGMMGGGTAIAVPAG
ncbi:ABC transporter substrate-binding protein [Paenibacillus cymbidii]|uniref:ABC transporter substrate-binding protein n=1 Tax=Paenibacillus cymbidii TaxID=1639034 RepID=UPI001F283CBD|nr:extracellular solute-binding protein [Paenibacillus cymbidii]